MNLRRSIAQGARAAACVSCLSATVLCLSAIGGLCLSAIGGLSTPLLAQANGNGAAEAEVVPGAGGAGALLKAGMTAFEEGNLNQAIKLFEQAFALNPTHDEILRALEGAEATKALRMARDANPKIAGIGHSLLELRQRARRMRSGDAERIKAQIDKVFGAPDEDTRLVEMLRGAQEFGRNLAPSLIAKLGDNEPSVRAQAYLWILKIESEAIPPLLAAVHHPSALVRQHVARLLGAQPLRDVFALGALKGMAETDSDPDAKAAAAESFEVVRREKQRQNLSAKEYHLGYAVGLYKWSYRNTFARPEYTSMVYSLKGEEVVGEPVADFQLSPRMAEIELVEALRLDPSFVPAKVQRLCNEALQVVEYDATVASGAAEKDAALKAILDSQKTTMDSVRRLRLKSQSRDVLSLALSQALHNSEKPEVAQKLIEVMDELALRGPVPQSLIEALTTGSSRLVRIAAATTLARWNPADGGDFQDAVVSTLAEAAVSSGIRTVHKAMGNADRAARLDGVLRELNLESSLNSRDVVEAKARTVELPPDLVMIDDELKSTGGQAPVNQLVNELRKSYRTQGTPVVVVVDPAKLADQKALYESAERKVVVIPADADKATFKTLVIDRLFSGSDDEKARATRMAGRAAQSLAALAGMSTAFPVAKAVAPLLQTLSNRPDEVRIPALAALGNLREAAAPALKPMGEVFANGENSPAVRRAAMVAIAQILAARKEGASEELMKSILAGMDDADPEIRAASFAAFGSSGAKDDLALRKLTDEVQPPAAAEKEAPAKSTEKGEKGPDAKKEGDAPAEEPKKDAPEEKAEKTEKTEEGK